MDAFPPARSCTPEDLRCLIRWSNGSFILLEVLWRWGSDGLMVSDGQKLCITDLTAAEWEASTTAGFLI